MAPSDVSIGACGEGDHHIADQRQFRPGAVGKSGRGAIRPSIE